MRSKEETKEEFWRKEIAQAQAGDKKARESLVTENMGLVYMVVKRFTNRGADPQELSQIGAIGLIKAIDRFDPLLPYSFSTYAVPLIMGEIRRFLRDDGMIHTSRQIKDHARKIAIIRENLKKTENKEPTLQELVKETGLSAEEIVEAMDAVREVDSISRPIAEDGGKVLTLEDELEDGHHFETPLLNHLALKQVLNELEKDEAELIELRYMQNRSQTEVAQILGTNQVAVSRMERKILCKLRRKLS